MRTWFFRLSLLVAVLAGALTPAHAAVASFSDVPSNYWDNAAITYVAQTNTWMQDYGSSLFKPTTNETRELLARALVEAYAPNEPIDPTITFPDLPTTDPFYPYANVAVKLGWIAKNGGGKFAPTGEIKVKKFDKAIVLAMGSLGDAISGLKNIHQDDGDTYSVDGYFAYIQLAHWLGLHFNHDDETMDLEKEGQIHRDEVAYSLWEAKTLPSWEISDAATFNTISLPALSETTGGGVAKQAVTQYALDQLGFPYIWGGEWNAASPPGYCCGSQPQGGMDCSGFAWWVMKKNEASYNAAQYHPDYGGWPLAERTSTDMAVNTRSPVDFAHLKVGDVMFFATDGSGLASHVDHVGINLGDNWMIHSSGSGDGPALEWIGDGFYHDIFVSARRLIGAGKRATRWFDPTAGDGPRSGGEPGDPHNRRLLAS
jgi:hypothetical protein